MSKNLRGSQQYSFCIEYVNGGDLFDFINETENHRVSESQTAIIFSQILDSLHYLYNYNIAHRDIKLENFIISKEDSNYKVKLIDFGFASKTINHPFTMKIGSLNYLAPEMFTQVSYDFKVDLWAAGIVL